MDKKLAKTLFISKLGIFIVFAMWNLDKFVNPEHTVKIFEKYYMVAGLAGSVSYIIGALQFAILFMFMFGMYKKFSYGVMLFMHAISTLSAWKMYINPWQPPNLLFYAAWPMLATLIVLYMYRDEDTLFNLGKKSISR